MVKGGRGLYMEVREKASGTVWMSLDPVTKEDFASLELSEEYEPLGFARASMDRVLQSSCRTMRQLKIAPQLQSL